MHYFYGHVIVGGNSAYPLQYAIICHYHVGCAMNTVILDVRMLKDSLADFTNALTTGNPQNHDGSGVLSICEVARRVNRDVTPYSLISTSTLMMKRIFG